MSAIYYCILRLGHDGPHEGFHTDEDGDVCGVAVPAVLLRDTPEDRERLLLACLSVPEIDAFSSVELWLDAIIAALRESQR